MKLGRSGSAGLLLLAAACAEVVATALRLGATLVTADQRLRDYPPLPTLWD